MELEIFFFFFHPNRPNQKYFQTFPDWKMTKIYSALLKTPYEPCVTYALCFAIYLQ